MTTHPHHPSCPGRDLCTLDSDDTDAEIARRRDWKVGTRLEGVEYGARDVIELTAVGRDVVLGVEIDSDYPVAEDLCVLYARCWGEVKP